MDSLLWGSQPAVFRKAVLSDQHFSRVLDYIHGHYTEQMSVDKLSSIALQSRYHFIRTFRTLTGLTPYQYVLQLRIEKAKDQLGSTATTVEEISYNLGFSSASQFYRAFLKSTG
ncbi:helix-turn-helix domain-containing protein [Paenibacillus mendelii]|uniref:Helix-turn-helix domain-containing protein n=1 Tax=Paenibacillus mendelii TaxID=206163 RepID=A0ABV6J7Q9_9BACL|nr:AraC family transcriptional regulator [Paenibacillus mendelii]